MFSVTSSSVPLLRVASSTSLALALSSLAPPVPFASSSGAGRAPEHCQHPRPPSFPPHAARRTHCERPRAPCPAPAAASTGWSTSPAPRSREGAGSPRGAGRGPGTLVGLMQSLCVACKRARTLLSIRSICRPRAPAAVVSAVSVPPKRWACLGRHTTVRSRWRASCSNSSANRSNARPNASKGSCCAIVRSDCASSRCRWVLSVPGRPHRRRRAWRQFNFHRPLAGRPSRHTPGGRSEPYALLAGVAATPRARVREKPRRWPRVAPSPVTSLNWASIVAFRTLTFWVYASSLSLKSLLFSSIAVIGAEATKWGRAPAPFTFRHTVRGGPPDAEAAVWAWVSQPGAGSSRPVPVPARTFCLSAQALTAHRSDPCSHCSTDAFAGSRRRQRRGCFPRPLSPPRGWAKATVGAYLPGNR